MLEAEEYEYEISMERKDNYKFIVDFGKNPISKLLLDEGEEIPGGEGLGPSASMILAAAVGNCLSASLTFCVDKKKIDLKEFKTKVWIRRERNKEGFWRISGMKIKLYPFVENAKDVQFLRCIEIFKNYCIVSASVQEGIPLDVEVIPNK